jgi:hypothetical protein
MANYAEAASFDINANDKDPYPRYMANYAEVTSFDIKANDKDPYPRYMANYCTPWPPALISTPMTRIPTPGT